MPKSDWMSETTTLERLYEVGPEIWTNWNDTDGSEPRYALTFLKYAGLVPWDVMYVQPPRNHKTMTRNSINVGYLAGIAYEWDSWGPSTPEEFIHAIECELDDSQKRDNVSRALTALGREAGRNHEATLATNAT